MFIDHITLMLVNMASGLLLLGLFVLLGLPAPNRTPWAPAFAIVGLVAFVTGLHMTLTWPLPKLEQADLRWANVAYGEMSVLLGALFLAAALATGLGWHLLPVAIYGASAGVVAIVVGLRIGMLRLSASPEITTLGYLLAGIGGVLFMLAVLIPRHKGLRVFTAVDLFLAAALWCFTGLMAYWAHLARFSGKGS